MKPLQKAVIRSCYLSFDLTELRVNLIQEPPFEPAYQEL